MCMYIYVNEYICTNFSFLIVTWAWGKKHGIFWKNKGYAGLRVGRLDLGWRGLKEEKAIEISKTSMRILNDYMCIYNYMH